MSRINLSQRIIIESGIYQRLNLTEIAKKIGMSVTAVSNEIKLNRTPAKGSKPHGNDCRFANEYAVAFKMESFVRVGAGGVNHPRQTKRLLQGNQQRE